MPDAAPPPHEARALAALAFGELRRAASGIETTHRAIATRAFTAAGAREHPSRRLHDAIAGGVYAATRGATAAAGTVTDRALDRPPVPPGRALSTSRGGATLIGVIDGFVGDALARDGDPLAEPMSVRVGGRAVPPERAALARAFPSASGRIVVFVHGLMETERAWRRGTRELGGTYGELLQRDLGTTAVVLRFNSGLHVSENGSALAELLDALCAAWPVPVERIDLVGHSMGGLVVRSAGGRALGDGRAWVARVGTVVSLGTPHLGAPLEQAVHWASGALSVLPETRAFAGLLRRRSGGIRDMRGGSLLDVDWRGRPPDALRAGVLAEVPLLDGVTHCFVTATISRRERHPLGVLLGDGIVRSASASASGSGRGRTRRIGFSAASPPGGCPGREPPAHLHVGGVHHFALLGHPAVYAQLREWLAA